MKVTIDPITRLEGHGKIEIFLDDEGDVANAYLQFPELRGFEKFCEGRRVEEMPNITSRICVVCPEAHSMASLKTLDAVFNVGPEASPAERNIFGLIVKVGKEVGLSVIKHRLMGHKIIQIIGGRQIHANYAVPGGVSKPISEGERDEIKEMAKKWLNSASSA